MGGVTTLPRPALVARTRHSSVGAWDALGTRLGRAWDELGIACLAHFSVKTLLQYKSRGLRDAFKHVSSNAAAMGGDLVNSKVEVCASHYEYARGI